MPITQVKGGQSGCFQYLAVGVSALFLLISVLIGLLPDVIDPRVVQLPDRPKLEGALKQNTLLATASLEFFNQLPGPEGLAIDHEKGLLYTGLSDGRIVRVDLNTNGLRTLVKTFGRGPCGGAANETHCGRPLGLHLHEGKLTVLDSYLGIFRVDVETGSVQRLVSTEALLLEDEPVLFLNSLLRLTNGSWLLTHSSTRWQRRHFFHEFLEGHATGRLLRFDPDGSLHVVLRNLSFANGLTLTRDGSALLICETTLARVLRYELDGPSAGKVSVFTDNLPAFPDNIVAIPDGGYWLGTTGIRHADKPSIPDILAPWPSVRRLAHRVFGSLLLKFIPNYGLILLLEEDGRVAASLHDPSGYVSRISEVQQYKGKLYMGSYHNNFISTLPLNVKS